MTGQRKTNKKVDIAIGNRIHALRISCGRTVEKIAKAAELCLSDYIRGEQGERRFDAAELFAISQALGIGLADIISDLDRLG